MSILLHMPIREYVQALKASELLGPHVVHHEVLRPRAARCADVSRPWPASLGGVLASRGIEQLYAHQVAAADAVRAGRDVVVATPTASGKTLTFALPIIEEVLANPDARALCLFPLKALAQDQLRTFNELVGILSPDVRPTAGIFDGDTPQHLRKAMKEDPPNLLLTNPEMVHLSMLAWHQGWSSFFAGLTHIVLDEVHTYRGVMGSHMAHVFRRLSRIASYYGARPQWIGCSATIGNPGELMGTLTGTEPVVVSESGAPQGERHFVFVNPADAPSTTAIRLLQAALARGLRTIVYTQSRKMTELIALWASQKAGEYAGRISAYRSGFLPEERREIEAKMASGELLAVISTSALELGIDIGSLDLCILVGYPGTVMSTLQRGGRVGRQQQASGVVLVGGEDNLDQYFMRNPTDFFARPPESAVINPANPVIRRQHLVCAAAELPIKRSEKAMADPLVAEGVNALVASGELLEEADGQTIHARRKRPHREVNLRGSGERFTIEDEAGRVVGEIDAQRAYSETHTGAVYLHRGKSLVVQELDIAGRVARVAKKRVGYYTRARSEKETTILSVAGERRMQGTRVFHGRVQVTQRITGYDKIAASGGRRLAFIPLELPELTFETDGLWIEFPQAVEKVAEAGAYHFMGGIHAVEHAAIGIAPLIVMADRNDLGGISTTYHPQVGCAAVFIHDGAPGGAGLTTMAWQHADELFEKTLATIEGCPCETGCPSCVHSPKCGSGNRPIFKDAAIVVLRALAGCHPNTTAMLLSTPVEEREPDNAEQADTQAAKPVGCTVHQHPGYRPHRYGVLDVETRRSAAEVGGWNRADRMGVSVAVLWDNERETFMEYTQDQIPALAERLAELDMVIGYNICGFDWKVLAGVLPNFDWQALPTLDLLLAVKERIGYRLKLDTIATATVNAPKSADGLQALAWWKEGKLDEIARYCTQDVAITRDVYEYGKTHGHVLFTNKAGSVVRAPVTW